MKKEILLVISFWVMVVSLGVSLMPQEKVLGATILYPIGGGTGSSTLTGILLGNGRSSVQTLTIGSNLTLSGTTLSASITGGSGAPFPFTSQSYGVSTSTVVNFTAGLMAGTSTLNGALTLNTLTDGSLAVGTNGLVYKAATTTFSTGLTYANGAVTCDVASGSQAGCLSSANWTTFNSKQSTISATWPITLSGAVVGWGGLSTSTTPTAGQLAYWGNTTQLTSVATGTISATSPVTVTAARYVIGGAATVAWDFTVANTWTGKQTFAGATTTALTASSFFQLPNSTTQSPTLAGACGFDTTSGQLKCGDGTATRVMSNGYEYPSFTYATSTAWTGTTTVPLGPAYVGETWNGVQCYTDVGTVNVSIYDGTNRMDLFNASTTVGTVTLSTNNTFTAAEKRYVDIGTPASSPTKVSCTVSKSLTAD